jgi:hypothetical protein
MVVGQVAGDGFGRPALGESAEDAEDELSRAHVDHALDADGAAVAGILGLRSALPDRPRRLSQPAALNAQ